MRVEKALTNLLVKEVKYQMKAESLKRTLEQSYDFSVAVAFKAVDDWNYNYIDFKNLRRFLRNMGFLASKQELIAIIRRIDTDGDSKLKIDEFSEGVRSQFSQISHRNGVSSPKINKSSSKSELRSSQYS